MEPAGIIFLAVVFALVLLLGIIIFAHYGQLGKINQETQRQITDHGILELIDAQPDGLLTVRQLADHTGMPVSQARRRLMMLQQWGVLKIMYSNNLQSYYSLMAPLDKRTPPELSPEPFLTVDDILRLFQHFDFRLSPQNLIHGTKLPANILKREMQYFRREGIVQLLHQYVEDANSQKLYVLREPYRSQPEQFLQQQGSMDLELKEILRKEDLI